MFVIYFGNDTDGTTMSRHKNKTSPALFENQKIDLILEFCVYFWAKFSIRNVVLRLSRREKSKTRHCGAYFSCVFGKMFIEVP